MDLELFVFMVWAKKLVTQKSQLTYEIRQLKAKLARLEESSEVRQLKAKLAELEE